MSEIEFSFDFCVTVGKEKGVTSTKRKIPTENMHLVYSYIFIYVIDVAQLHTQFAESNNVFFLEQDWDSIPR
jgi:hypothetical protein